MSLIRIRAVERLGQRIGQCLPDLADNVCAGAVDHPKRQTYPHISIQASSGVYLPDQHTLAACPNPSTGVFNLGRMEINSTIFVGAATLNERYTIQDRVLQAIFFSDIERPGIFVDQIPDCESALVAWELEESEWEDFSGLGGERFGRISVTAYVPVLTSKGGTYTISEICLQLTEDVDSAVTAILPTDIETTTITA